MKKLLPILFIFPNIVFAAGLTDFIDEAFSIVTNILTPLAFALCLLYFFWGVAKYIWSEGQGKAEGKMVMIWGVVGLFVAMSVWGIVSFLQGEFNITPFKDVQLQKNK